jgi:hypothetical protein
MRLGYSTNSGGEYHVRAILVYRIKAYPIGLSVTLRHPDPHAPPNTVCFTTCKNEALDHM